MQGVYDNSALDSPRQKKSVFFVRFWARGRFDSTHPAGKTKTPTVSKHAPPYRADNFGYWFAGGRKATSFFW